MYVDIHNMYSVHVGMVTKVTYVHSSLKLVHPKALSCISSGFNMSFVVCVHGFIWT